MARLTRITLKLPCRPSVPKTTAQLPLPFSTSPCFAVRTASPRTLRISLCSYVSRVNFLEYGSYRNAGTEGLAIMIDSRWNRPSPTYLPKESALVQSTWSLGDLHEPIDMVQLGSGASQYLAGTKRFRLRHSDLISTPPNPDIRSSHPR